MRIAHVFNSSLKKVIPFLVCLVVAGICLKVRYPGINQFFAYSFEDHMLDVYTIIKHIFQFFSPSSDHPLIPISNDPTYFDGHYILVALSSFIVLFLKQLGLISADISQHDFSLFIYTGRHLSLILQVGTVCLTYLALNCLTKRPLLNGLLTTLFVSFSPLWFIIDLLRLDHFLCFSIALSIYCAIKTLKNPTKTGWHIGNGVSSALILSTKINSGIYLILVLAIYAYLILNKKLPPKAYIAVTTSFLGFTSLLFFRWIMHAPLIIPTINAVLLEARVKLQLGHNPNLYTLVRHIWAWNINAIYDIIPLNYYTLTIGKAQLPITKISAYLLLFILSPIVITTLSLTSFFISILKKQKENLFIISYIFIILLSQLFTESPPRYLIPFPLFYCFILGIALNQFLSLPHSLSSKLRLDHLRHNTLITERRVLLFITILLNGSILLGLCLPFLTAQFLINSIHLKIRRQEMVAQDVRLKGKEWIQAFCKEKSRISHHSSSNSAIISIPLNNLPIRHIKELITCNTQNEQTTTTTHTPFITNTPSSQTLSQETDLLVLSSRRTQTHLNYLENRFSQTPLNNQATLEQNIATDLAPITTTQFQTIMTSCLRYLWQTQDNLSNLLTKDVTTEETPTTIISNIENITTLLNRIKIITKNTTGLIKDKHHISQFRHEYHQLIILTNKLTDELNIVPHSIFHDMHQSVWKEAIIESVPSLTTLSYNYIKDYNSNLRLYHVFYKHIDLSKHNRKFFFKHHETQTYLNLCKTLHSEILTFQTTFPSPESLINDYVIKTTHFKTQIRKSLPHIFQKTYQIPLEQLTYDTLITTLGPPFQMIGRQALYKTLNKTPHLKLQSPYIDNDLYWIKLYITNPSSIRTKTLAKSLPLTTTMKQGLLIKAFTIPHHMEPLIHSIDTEVSLLDATQQNLLPFKKASTKIPARANKTYPFYTQWLPNYFQSDANWATKMDFTKDHENPFIYEQMGAFFYAIQETMRQEDLSYIEALKKRTHHSLLPFATLSLPFHWKSFKDLSVATDFSWNEPLNPDLKLTQAIQLPEDTQKEHIRTRYRINLTDSTHGEWTDFNPLIP